MTPEERDKILHKPFNIETHKQAFINYCEVIIWPDGKIEYAMPSHSEKMLEAYANANGMSRNEALEEVRAKFGFDAIEGIMKELQIIEVWYDYIYNETPLTEKQFEALQMLISYECISDRCLESFCVL